jgi:DNA processing protein
VAAVPGRITSIVARGTNNLLKDGATPISGTEDVLDELFGVGARRVPSLDGMDAPEDPFLRTVLEAIEGCDSVEMVARVVDRRVPEIRAALGRLEAEGYVTRTDVGGWERVAG